MKSPFFCHMFWCMLSTAAMAVAAAEAVPHRCLELPPGEGNPRNSEGAFLALKDGRILYIYSRYNGKAGDDADPADLAARYSSDGGETWTQKDEIVVKNEGGMNVMSVSLLRLMDGRIAFFYLRTNTYYEELPYVRYSSDEGVTWTEPAPCVLEPNGYYVMNNDRAIQLQSGPFKGRIILPLARHALNSDEITVPEGKYPWDLPDNHWDILGVVTSAYSDDNGATWRMAKSVLAAFDDNGERVNAQEPGVVERKDGSLLMFFRSRDGQFFSTSNDGGDTWTAPVYTLHGPCAPCSMKRLPNGDLVAIWNDYDAVPEESRDQRRTPLSTAISTDDGKTWLHTKALEGNFHGCYCYTAIHVMEDSLLLGYCALNWLTHSRITKVPIAYLYTDGPEKRYDTTPGCYDKLPQGPFTTLEAVPGTWTVTSGAAEVISFTRGTGLHLQGGDNVTVELTLPKATRLADLPPMGLERYTKTPPYTVTVEAMKDGEWTAVCVHGDGVKTARQEPVKWSQPDMVTNKLRFRCTSAGGTIICDGNQKFFLVSYFKD